ncbi:hypothetical protein Spa11_25150 [Botrimarina mediterranea]|uniref:Uncharacterized protein n=1 Tax=Botrimarina mediterranea TaxID=2528022 RepID=A0A518K962_9BACT|nr:hypothetical protein Spa11_25150 [Botrimarina mediterranea]
MANWVNSTRVVTQLDGQVVLYPREVPVAENLPLLQDRLLALYFERQAAVGPFTEPLSDLLARQRVMRLIESAVQQGMVAQLDRIRTYEDALSLECLMTTLDGPTKGQAASSRTSNSPIEAPPPVR